MAAARLTGGVRLLDRAGLILGAVEAGSLSRRWTVAASVNHEHGLTGVQVDSRPAAGAPEQGLDEYGVFEFGRGKAEYRLSERIDQKTLIPRSKGGSWAGAAR